MAAQRKPHLDGRWHPSAHNLHTKWLSGGEDLYHLHERNAGDTDDDQENARGITTPAWWGRLIRFVITTFHGRPLSRILD